MDKIDFKKITPILKNSGVKSAGVFGSYIKGKKRSNDIDILVEFQEPLGLLGMVRLENTLSQKLNIPVDLVTKKSLSPYIRDQILNETQIFYEQR